MAEDNKDVLGNLIENNNEPWSLEETQKKIENLLKKKIKSGGIDSKNLGLIVKNISKLTGNNKTTKNIEDELKKVHKEGVKETTLAQKIFDYQKQKGKSDAAYQKDITSKAAKEILKGGTSNTIAGSINSLDKGIGNVITHFQASISGLGKTLTIIPLVGGTLGALVGWMGNQIESYRNLIGIGQTFGGNMITMNLSAKDAAMHLDEFGKFITKYSKLSAKVSAEGLARMTKDVRMTTRQFGHFGLGIERTNDFIASYTQQLVLQGRFDKIDAETRRFRTANYLRQLTELAEITGKSVDQLNEERQALAENVDKFAIMAEMTDEQRAKFEAGFDVFEAGLAILPKEMQGPFQQTALQFQRWGTIANTELGGLMANLGGPVVDSFEHLMSVMKAGDPNQTKSAMADFIMSLTNSGKSTEEMANITAFMFEGNVEEARKFARSIQALQIANIKNKKTIEGSITSAQNEAELTKLRQDKFNEDTEKMLGLQESLRSIYAEISARLVEHLAPSITNIARIIGDWAERLINWIQNGGLDSALTWLTTTFTELTTEGSSLNTAISGIIGIIKFLGNNVAIVGGIFATIIGLKLLPLFKGLAGGIKWIIGLARGGGVASSLAAGAGAGGGLLTKAGSFIGNIGKSFLGLGGAVAGGLTGAALIGKDVYDVATAEKGQIKNEDIGGIVGGITGGAIGILAGPAGVAIGAALGNAAGEWIGGLFDNSETEKAAISTSAMSIKNSKLASTNEVIKEEPIPAITETTTTVQDLLLNIQQTIERQNEILMGIAGATGDTATHTKKTLTAIGDSNSTNLQ